MTLALIGAGLGRTGTSSLRDALNFLGYPCYHMTELAFNVERRGDLAFWENVRRGPAPERADWGQVFDAYRAVLDYPACLFWRDLMASYPAAKVVLTLHPGGSDAWYDSTRETIFAEASSQGASDFGRRFNAMMERQVWGGFFGGRFSDRAEAIARYEAHAQAVRDGVPADRLLVWSPDEGWAPICAALGVAEPDVPFPNRNSRAEMARRVERLERMKGFTLGRPAPKTGTRE